VWNQHSLALRPGYSYDQIKIGFLKTGHTDLCAFLPTWFGGIGREVHDASLLQIRIDRQSLGGRNTTIQSEQIEGGTSSPALAGHSAGIARPSSSERCVLRRDLDLAAAEERGAPVRRWNTERSRNLLTSLKSPSFEALGDVTVRSAIVVGWSQCWDSDAFR